MGRYIQIDTPNGKKRWRLVRAKLPQNQHLTNWGECDYDKRVIAIHQPLSAVELLRTTIHEAAHAACPDLSEHAIERIEFSVAQALLPVLPEITDDLTE